MILRLIIRRIDCGALTPSHDRTLFASTVIVHCLRAADRRRIVVKGRRLNERSAELVCLAVVGRAWPSFG